MEEDRELPLIEHLLELRSRLLKSVAAVVLVFIALAPWAQEVYTLLAQPLMKHLPEGSSMIAIDVASPFFTPYKLTLVLAFFLAIPYVLYQAWAFVAPGLYRHEKRLALPLLVFSVLLFYLGAAFAYFVVLPILFQFMTRFAPEGVRVMTDISRYLDFVLTLFFAFGVAFEVPILTILLVWAGLVERETLKKMRPYVIVAAFVVGMFLTPPDVISQTLLAVPMWLLYELGVLSAHLFEPRESPISSTEEGVSSK